MPRTAKIARNSRLRRVAAAAGVALLLASASVLAQARAGEGAVSDLPAAWSRVGESVSQAIGSTTAAVDRYWRQSEAEATASQEAFLRAMALLGFRLETVTSEGALVTTTVQTFVRQRQPTPAELVQAAPVLAETRKGLAGVWGYVAAGVLDRLSRPEPAGLPPVATVQFQTKPYPSVRYVSGVQPAPAR